MPKIATEEAVAPAWLLDAWRRVLARGSSNDRGFERLFGRLLHDPESAGLMTRLCDVHDARIREMDASAVTLQLLSLAAPGVQVFEPAEATSLARDCNDWLAGVIAQHPDRYAGLAALAPQAPKAAAAELQRAVRTLGLRGAIINSHTLGRYLDDPEYYPIFESAQELGVPIYLHPTTPRPDMLQPYLDYGLAGPAWGFAAETSLHALRLIMCGTFDRFPRLQMVLGHLGEGLPFWLPRIDSRTSIASLSGGHRLQRRPSAYFRENIAITTSGMNWSEQVLFALRVLEPSQIMFAADYPYESLSEAVALMASLPVSSDLLRNLFYQNAVRIFGLDQIMSGPVHARHRSVDSGR